MVMFGDKLCRHFVVKMTHVAHDTRLEIAGILAVFQHLTVIVTLNHQIVGEVHIVGRALGDGAHVGSHNKTLPLILDAEAHALNIVARFKGSNLHVQHTERDLLENRHMKVLDAAGDAATLQQLAHHAHRAIDAAPAAAHRRIETTHVVLVGMGKQDAPDHLARHAIALQFGKGLVQVEDIILALFALAFGLGRRLDARIDENAATRSSQICAVATAAAAETHETQSLAHTIILGLFLRPVERFLSVGRVITVHIK